MNEETRILLDGRKIFWLDGWMDGQMNSLSG